MRARSRSTTAVDSPWLWFWSRAEPVSSPFSFCRCHQVRFALLQANEKKTYFSLNQFFFSLLKPVQLKVEVYRFLFLCKSFFVPVAQFFSPSLRFSFSPPAPVLQISVSKVLLGSLPNFGFDSAHCLGFHRLPADVSACCRASSSSAGWFFHPSTVSSTKGVRKSTPPPHPPSPNPLTHL